ncbi:L,D-transpeptidase family protein [Streptomyces bambusae]|uniref:L,D-transpeptidase family protein n=1 Tax=Streptomyces bambusae TaxID=1550616 RepID=UPI001CFE0F50|nr:L,D-transpeptidase family protein [Streptomyces bambusae]MCB5166588.1 L,D-transpeptidase family protein [Streptomyces bambusae]
MAVPPRSPDPASAPVRRRSRGTGPYLLAGALALLALGPAGGPAAAAEPPCTARTGPYQRELEEHLKRPVDGRNSEADCTAIRTFQRTHRIEPADGYPDLLTYRTLVALRARANPNAAGRCPVRPHRVTCVDMDRQLLWVQRDSKVVFPPVPVRTGRDEEETRPGWHEIYWRNRDHVSSLFPDSPMPYAQFFDGGQAIHGRPGDMFDNGGSAGCVNLTVPDAARLWNLLTEGDAVYVWGTRTGTED